MVEGNDGERMVTMLSYAQIAYLRAFGAGAPTGGTLDELMAE